jgi:uncharacterized protein YutE (UPF0331/DUF86 family)
MAQTSYVGFIIHRPSIVKAILDSNATKAGEPCYIETQSKESSISPVAKCCHEAKDQVTAGKCLNICESSLNVIDKDEALVVKNLNGFRDASVHDIVDISEGLLYGHAQSAVQIFAALMKKALNRDLSRVLPRRILPIATVMPTDITAIVAEDMDTIKSLLGRKRRREDDAEARLRPYLVIERNIREGQSMSLAVPSVTSSVRNLKGGDWKAILPMVAGLVQSVPGGIPMSLHVTKGEGFAVRIDPKAPTAIAFRYIKPEDKYPYLTGELAKKLGVNPSRVVAFVKMFQMKGNDDYHTSIRVSTTGKVQRYSEKAYRVLANAVASKGADALWEQCKEAKALDPQIYLHEPKPAAPAPHPQERPA